MSRKRTRKPTTAYLTVWCYDDCMPEGVRAFATVECPADDHRIPEADMDWLLAELGWESERDGHRPHIWSSLA